MEELKERIFNFILKRQAARKVSMPRWQDVRTVAILYPENNIPHIINQIEKEQKEAVFNLLPFTIRRFFLYFESSAEIVCFLPDEKI